MFFMNKKDKQKNILGEELEVCSTDPVTGWYRDGCCNTDENDNGTHTVCAKVTDDLLIWLKDNGNDLITPRPEYNFENKFRALIGKTATTVKKEIEDKKRIKTI